jgi:hypothetical protein
MLLIGALTWPLYLSSSSFTGSWLEDLWFMWHQNQTIAAGHLPSLFFNYPRGVFYPEYAFYGGTLNTVTGTLTYVLGNSPLPAYVLTYVFAAAAAYGGWYWIARQAGLGVWQCQAPGLVFVTSSYYLTMIYADGDWPELMAVSMIPLMIAAALSILRARTLRVGPAIALLIGCILFAGSHVLTLVWGSTTIGILGLAIVICVPQARQQFSRRGVGRVARLMVPALLASAWFLVPAAAYESSTWIASEYPAWQSVLRGSMSLVSMHHLFTLSRATASPSDTAFALSLPILVMAWVLVGFVLALPAGLRCPWVRALCVCVAFTACLIVLMTHAGLILALPRYYSTLQFSYRLENYVLLGVSGAVLSILVLAQGRLRRLRFWTFWALPPVLVVAVVGAAQQTAAYPATTNRNAAVAGWSDQLAVPESTSSEGVLKDYIDVHEPLLNGSRVHQPLLSGSEAHPQILRGSFRDLAMIDFATSPVQGERLSAESSLRSGELANSNLFAPPSFVRVTGARIVGINAEDGADVLEADPDLATSHGGGAPSASALISVTSSASFPIVLGRLLTICAAVALLVQIGALAVRRRKRTT